MKAREHFAALEAQLNEAFLERREVIRGMMMAMVYERGGNILMLGPRGTAKSSLAKAVCRAAQGNFFQILISKTTPIEGITGLVNLAKLTQGTWEIGSKTTIQGARVAFLDEIYKGGSAILNALLELLEDREIDILDQRVNVQKTLRLIVGASNEIPEDPVLLAAFDDRWHLRYWLEYIQDPDNFLRMLRGQVYKAFAELPDGTLEEAIAEIEQITIPGEIDETILRCRQALADEGIEPSDRKWARFRQYLRNHAYFEGRDRVEGADIAAMAQHMLWYEPSEQATVAEVVGKLADPVGTKIREMLDAALEARNDAMNATGDAKAIIAICVEANTAFQHAKAQLNSLRKDTGHPKIDEAFATIDGYHAEVTKRTTEAFGMRTGE